MTLREQIELAFRGKDPLLAAVDTTFVPQEIPWWDNPVINAWLEEDWKRMQDEFFKPSPFIAYLREKKEMTFDGGTEYRSPFYYKGEGQ